MKRINGFVALRRIFVDGETKDHGYVYHVACTTVKSLSHWAAAVGEKLRTAFARQFPKYLQTLAGVLNFHA